MSAARMPSSCESCDFQDILELGLAASDSYYESNFPKFTFGGLVRLAGWAIYTKLPNRFFTRSYFCTKYERLDSIPGRFGFDAVLYQRRGTSDELVFAFRGTEPWSPIDWLQNCLQFFALPKWWAKIPPWLETSSLSISNGVTRAKNAIKSILPEWTYDRMCYQYKKAIVEALNAKEDAAKTNKKLRFTGHSLGGGLATAAAWATGLEALVFEAAGLSEATVAELKKTFGDRVDFDDRSKTKKVVHVNVKGDWVSDHNKKMDDTTLNEPPYGECPCHGSFPECKQYGGRTVWLDSMKDAELRSMWKFLPKCFNNFLLAILHHFPNTFLFQLESRAILSDSRNSTKCD